MLGLATAIPTEVLSVAVMRSTRTFRAARFTPTSQLETVPLRTVIFSLSTAATIPELARPPVIEKPIKSTVTLSAPIKMPV